MQFNFELPLFCRELPKLYLRVPSHFSFLFLSRSPSSNKMLGLLDIFVTSVVSPSPGSSPDTHPVPHLAIPRSHYSPCQAGYCVRYTVSGVWKVWAFEKWAGNRSDEVAHSNLTTGGIDSTTMTVSANELPARDHNCKPTVCSLAFHAPGRGGASAVCICMYSTCRAGSVGLRAASKHPDACPCGSNGDSCSRCTR